MRAQGLGTSSSSAAPPCNLRIELVTVAVGANCENSMRTEFTQLT